MAAHIQVYMGLPLAAPAMEQKQSVGLIVPCNDDYKHGKVDDFTLRALQESLKLAGYSDYPVELAKKRLNH